MKRIVLVFGLIAGAIMSVMMAITAPFADHLDRSEVIGYTTMVLAFLLVFFGIRSYRDNTAGGAISFGKAFGVGILIALVASACYVATWEVLYYGFFPDFGQQYATHVLEAARASGASAADLAAKTKEMAQFQEMYRNPFINVGFTFIEVFPVGLVMTLVSAGILRRRSSSSIAQKGAAMAAS